MCVSIVCKHCHVNKELHAQQIRLRQHISPLKQRYIIQSWQSVNSHERLLLVSILQEMESDNIKSPIDGEIASRWDAYLLCDICRHFASVMLHFASLISHNLRCIPAYTHLIPTGFFQSSLNDYRDNLYIISKLKMGVSRFFQSPQHTLIFVSILVSTDFNQPLRLRFLGR